MNTNEDAVLVSEWHRQVGQHVPVGELIVSVETTKASMDVLAQSSGYLRWIAGPAGATVPVGSALFIMTTEPDEAYAVSSKPHAASLVAKGANPRTATLKAKMRARELGVDLDEVRAVGDVIAEEDVVRHVTMGSIELGRSAVPKRYGPRSLVIVGDGGHARFLRDTAERGQTYTVEGCTSDSHPLGASVGGLVVLGRDSDLPRLYAEGLRKALVGVGSARGGRRSNEGRRRIFEQLKAIGFEVPVVVDPDASVSSSASIEEGSVVGAGAIVSANVKIGRNCLINVGAIVCHDCFVADHVHLTPGAILAGGVTVGEETTIGMAATILDGTNVGRRCLVVNGARVINDVADDEVYRG